MIYGFCDPKVLYTEDLADTRYAKRRREDEASSERATRRRLERLLYDCETKVVEAQKPVDDAHSLVCVEAKTRRRCEEAISKEQAKRRRTEECLKRQAQAPGHYSTD